MTHLSLCYQIQQYPNIPVHSSQTGKNKLPTHIEINSKLNGLKADSVVLTEQIRTIDKSRLKEKIGHIDDLNIMNKVNNAIGISFGLEN